jgi:probable HAF family extracellular repeat protein
VRWTPNGAGGYTRTELGALPGYTGSVATAINNLGDIVGYSRSGMFRYAVLFTAPGGVLDLNPLGVFDPQAINDSRQMLDKQCKRLDLDTMVVETFPLPSGPPTYSAITGYSINELGQIAGTAVLATSTSCVYQAARHMDDYGWQMLSTCSPLANAYDINDIGDVLFQAIGITNIVHLEGIGDYTGQLLLGPNAGPYTVHSVGAINDSRQLAVIATNTATGVTGVAIMSPLGVCQADLGFDGPGASQLSVCGGNLAVGTTANLTLYGAGENSTAFLIAGVSAAPMNWLGGTLVPVPLIVVAIPTGPTGTTLVPIAGGLGAVSIYLQAAHVDAAQPMGVGISNAVRIDFLP